jgi:hypothetical protein
MKTLAQQADKTPDPHAVRIAKVRAAIEEASPWYAGGLPPEPFAS